LLKGFYIENKLSLILISLILGIIILNKRILLPFLILVPTGIILMYNTTITPYYVFLAIFLGGISHIMLDLFTPSGIKLLNPLSSRKFKKNLGIILFILWIFGIFIFNFKDILSY
jgi:inner membrane protein